MVVDTSIVSFALFGQLVRLMAEQPTEADLLKVMRSQGSANNVDCTTLRKVQACEKGTFGSPILSL